MSLFSHDHGLSGKCPDRNVERARLTSGLPGLRQFAPSHQFDQLVQAVEREHPSKATQMREWSVAAQHARLDHLASMVEQKAGWACNLAKNVLCHAWGSLATGTW